MYVQIPASAFYFVLGIICGIISIIFILSMYAKKEAKKKQEMMKNIFGNIKIEDNEEK